MKIVLCYDMPKEPVAPAAQLAGSMKPAGAMAMKPTVSPKVGKQLEFLLRYLPAAGHNATAMGFTGSPDKYADSVRGLRPSAVWNLFDSFQGIEALAHTGALLLDDIIGNRGTPVLIGSPTQTMLFTQNPLIAASILTEARLPALGHYSLGDAPSQLTQTCFQWLLKPVAGSGKAYPIEATGTDGLQKAIILHSLQGEYYAEQYVAGRQFYMALLGNGHLKPVAIGEIQGKSVSFSTLPASLVAKLQELATACVALLQLNGFAAISFTVDRQGKVYIAKIDARPMLTERSLFAQACASAGIDAAKMLVAITTPK